MDKILQYFKAGYTVEVIVYLEDSIFLEKRVHYIKLNINSPPEIMYRNPINDAYFMESHFSSLNINNELKLVQFKVGMPFTFEGTMKFLCAYKI